MRTFTAALLFVAILVQGAEPGFAEGTAAPESQSKTQEAKQAVKDGAHAVGTATRKATRAVGHGARDAAKAIGHGTRDVVHGVGDAADKAWHDVTK